MIAVKLFRSSPSVTPWRASTPLRSPPNRFRTDSSWTTASPARIRLLRFADIPLTIRAETARQSLERQWRHPASFHAGQHQMRTELAQRPQLTVHTCPTFGLLQVEEKRKAPVRGFLQSPLTDSNRRPAYLW